MEVNNNLKLEGAVELRELPLGDFPAGGSIGLASATVDQYTSITINQTSFGQTLTIPTPTITSEARYFFIQNSGTEAFQLLGQPINIGVSSLLFWNVTAAAWQFVSGKLIGGGWQLLFAPTPLTANTNYVALAAGTYDLPSGAQPGDVIEFIAASPSVVLQNTFGAIFSAPGPLSGVVTMPLFAKFTIFNVGGDNWSMVKQFPARVSFPDQASGTLGDFDSLMSDIWVINQTTAAQSMTLPLGMQPDSTFFIQVQNIGTQDLTVEGQNVAVGTFIPFLWNGTSWVAAAASTSGWALTGNSGLTDGVDNIFGTLDAIPVRLTVNSGLIGTLNTDGTMDLFGGTGSATANIGVSTGGYNVRLSSVGDSLLTMQSASTDTLFFRTQPTVGYVSAVAGGTLAFGVGSTTADDFHIDSSNNVVSRRSTFISDVYSGSGSAHNSLTFQGNATGAQSASWRLLNLIPQTTTNTSTTTGLYVDMTLVTGGSNLPIDVNSAQANTQAITRYANSDGDANEFIGNGSPETVVTGSRGDIYRRLDGTGQVYIKTTDAVATGWSQLLAATGTTVDYGSYTKTAQTFSAVGDLTGWTAESGNIATDGTNFSLAAGKTYEISAVIDFDNFNVASDTMIIGLVDSSNVGIPGSTSAVLDITGGTLLDRTKAAVNAIYTPVSATTVKLRVTTSAGTNSIAANTSLIIKQLGSTSNTVGTLPANDQSAAGYFDIGNMRIQWGTATGSSGGSVVVTLPAPFANTSYSVTGSVAENVGGIYRTQNGPARTTTGFNAVTFNDTGTLITAIFNWFAIGAKP